MSWISWWFNSAMHLTYCACNANFSLFSSPRRFPYPNDLLKNIWKWLFSIIGNFFLLLRHTLNCRDTKVCRVMSVYAQFEMLLAGEHCLLNYCNLLWKHKLIPVSIDWWNKCSLCSVLFSFFYIKEVNLLIKTNGNLVLRFSYYNICTQGIRSSFLCSTHSNGIKL